MPFSLKKSTVQGTFAGLAIHEDALRFIEIDEENNVTRQESVPLPEGCVAGGTIRNFEMLAAAFTQLHSATGRLREPVTIGIPSGDTIMRLVNLPVMSMDDVHGTIDLNFDEYFPYPRQDAVFDTVRIITPADLNERDEITIMAVAAKRELIEKLLDLARSAGLPAGAVEPSSFSMLRALPDSGEGLGVFANPQEIVIIYNGSGIFFRSANNRSGTQDLLNTIQYVETTYRNIRVSKLIFDRLNFQLRTDAGIAMENITDEFFVARGLALRNISEAQKIDLRPTEYVELERRRYSFNPNRIILWGLLVAFVMLSIGTMSFAWMRMRDLDIELEDMRLANTDLLARRTELARSNSELEKKQKQLEKILDFLKKDIPVLEVMSALENHFAAGVKLTEANFSQTSAMGGVTITIDGTASDEKAILAMTEGLKQSGLFREVRLPISLKAQTGLTVFKLLLLVKEVS